MFDILPLPRYIVSVIQTKNHGVKSYHIDARKNNFNLLRDGILSHYNDYDESLIKIYGTAMTKLGARRIFRELRKYRKLIDKHSENPVTDEYPSDISYNWEKSKSAGGQKEPTPS